MEKIRVVLCSKEQKMLSQVLKELNLEENGNEDKAGGYSAKIKTTFFGNLKNPKADKAFS